MIAAEFQLTQDDYVEAQLGHLSNRLRKLFTVGLPVLGAALAITVVIRLMDPAKTRQLIPSWIFLGAVLLLMGLLRSGMLQRMQFHRLKAPHQLIRFEAGDGGVVYRTSQSESTTKWEAFEKWQESKKSFLLYVQPKLFFVVPKRVLDLGQVTALRELLAGRIR